MSVDGSPAYVSAVLPGWLLAGVGVGLALPTILASATTGLPAERVATGSAVANTSRQIGIVLGVAGLVAVFGTPAGPDVLAAFDRAWFCARRYRRHRRGDRSPADGPAPG